LALTGSTGLTLAAVSFDVDLSLGKTFTDNPDYVDGVAESDKVTELSVGIPFRYERPTWTWGIQYRATYEKYDDFDELDHFDHLIRVDFGKTPSEKRSWGIDAYYWKTQSQELYEVDETASTFLTYRSDRQTVGVKSHMEYVGARDWTWAGSVGVSFLDIEEIEDFGSGLPPSETGTQVRYRAGFSGSHPVSRSTSLGFAYSVKFYDLDLSEDETMHRVAATLDHTVSRTTSISTSLGLLHRTEDDQVDVVGDLGVQKDLRQGEFSAALRRVGSNGGALPGGYTLNEIRLGYSDDFTGEWNWSTFARYSHRDPVDSDEDTLRRGRVGVGLRFRGTRLASGALKGVGFRVNGSLVDQSGSSDDALNSSYWIVAVAVVATLGI
jgi:hypothetical protein